MKLQTKSYILTVALVMFLTGAFFGQAIAQTASTRTVYLGAGSLTTGTDFIIWNEGTTYYSRNGATGLVTYSTNASYLIQTAIDSGNDIYIAAGDYTITNTIMLDDYTYLHGAGDASNLTLDDGSNTNLLQNEDQTNGNVEIKIERLWLDGNRGGQTGDGEVIDFRRVSYFVINDNFITGSYNRNNVFLDYDCHYGIISNNHITNAGLHGIEVFNAVPSTVTITGNIFNYNAATHIEIVDAVGVTVTGNWFLNAYGYSGSFGDGIQIHTGDASVTPENITITGNVFRDGLRYAIYLNLTANVVIAANTFNMGNSYIAIYDESAGSGYTIATDNIGYVTENWGESEASNDDWITHGLDGTPDLITLTVYETDANYVIQLKNKNATHFQIYLYDLDAAGSETVDKTILWHAEMDIWS